MELETEYVILLHGLGRTNRSFNKMAGQLRALGYCVVNLNYPSTKAPIETLAVDVINRSLALCEGACKIHFVTHSLGGILLRYYLEHQQIEKLANVVMLGPPNKGSEVVDRFANVLLYRLMTGPAGMQLGTDPKSLVCSLGPVDFKLGIIAGSASINLILSLFIKGVNDGKVSVERTKIEGMSDHITQHVAHPFLMRNQDSIEQVLHYLKYGCFAK